MSPDETVKIIMTEQQVELLHKTDRTVRDAQERLALVIAGILAAAGVEKGEIVKYDADERLLEVARK